MMVLRVHPQPSDPFPAPSSVLLVMEQHGPMVPACAWVRTHMYICVEMCRGGRRERITAVLH